jgi:probable HAF family extracellular repeat protein
MKPQMAALLASALLSSAAWLEAQSYTVTDLGVLAGDQMSTAQGLNDQGQAVGSSSNENGEFSVATLFSGGQAVSLGTLGDSDDTIAEAINGSGQITGYSYDTVSQISNTFLYSGGRLVDISDASLFPGGSDGTGINGAGQICGYGWPANSTNTHAFLYSGGTTVDLGTLGGAESVAEAIDSAGQVVGQSQAADGATHAFLYSNGRMQDLGIPSGDNASSAIAVSQSGLILGELGVGAVIRVGIYKNGAWSDVGAGATPTGVNNSGQIVGWTVIPGIYTGPKAQRRHAQDIGVVLVNGTFTNLNTLIPSGSGFTIIMADEINDSGQILCDASTPDDETHAVLLTPNK